MVELRSSNASDLDVVNAARISFGKQRETMDEADVRLIAFLMRNGHNSPFRHGYFQFYVRVPIFVQRDHFRHNAGHDYNEISTRYVVMEPEYYKPNSLRVQRGRPGAYYFEEMEPTQENEYSRELLWSCQQEAISNYNELLNRGVAREQAMAVLPMGLHTEFIWSCNPLALMNYIETRTRREARAEIQEVAWAVDEILMRQMPVTHTMFEANGRRAP